MGDNDHDDVSKRSLKIYKKGLLVSSATGTGLMNKQWLDANNTHTNVTKFYNNSSQTLAGQMYDYPWANLSALYSETADGSAVEAATYENKYYED